MSKPAGLDVIAIPSSHGCGMHVVNVWELIDQVARGGDTEVVIVSPEHTLPIGGGNKI